MPYTYVVTHLPSGKRYYGVRLKEKHSPSDDLWVRYFTSSKAIKKLIENDGKDVFSFQIRQVFEDCEAAAEWEYRFLRKTGVWRKDQVNWLNMCCGKTIDITKAMLSWTDERLAAWKANISHHNTGRKPSPETIEKTRAKTKGLKRSVETRQRISAAKTGVPLSETHRQSCKDAQSINRGKPVHPNLLAACIAANTGRKQSPEWIEKRCAPIRGRKHSEVSNQKMKDAWINRPRHTCVHCGLITTKINHSRWHGDNCKHKRILENGPNQST